MTPRLLLSIVLAAAIASAAAAQNRSPDFRSGASELVVLPVAVLEHRDGDAIQGLDRERFSVFDNGRRQDIALFTNHDVPVTIGLVIDNSGSMRSKLPEVTVAVLAFARLSNPDDELFTVMFNDRVLKSGRRFVRAADQPALESELHAMHAQGQTALYDALVAALEQLERSATSLKALVLISDGGDNASHAAARDVLERARRSNVTIYTIGLFDDGNPDVNPRLLKSLAESSGGERHLPKSPGELLQACSHIAHELRSVYTIGFVPQIRDGAYHRVRVEVTPDRGKFVVRTRPGYFAAIDSSRQP
jgi:Ca-activated chloride channel family protein